MFNSTNIDSSDEGVSPVIGVILMVAITVILAAVIGTFVLDLAGGVEQNPNASVDFEQQQSEMIDADNSGTANTQAYEVTVSAISLQSADSVQLSASDNDDSEDAGSAYDPSVGTTELTNAGDSSTVSQMTVGDTITVTGVLEQNEAVLQTYEVD